jgi:solute carrier family 25 phosphate transporter 23/24/25/41
MENLVYGGAAGCCAVTLTYPTDLLRRKRQVQIIMGEARNATYWNLVQSVYLKDGLAGFYTGLKATYYKVIPSTAFVFAINEFIKKQILH